MASSKIMRKRYLVDKETQNSITLGMFLYAVLIGGILGVDMYAIGLLDLGSRLPADGGMALWTVLRIMFIEEWLIFIPLYAINFCIVYFSLIYYTHRIAGPVQKCTGVLTDIAEGRRIEILNLRKNDYFKPLAQAINSLNTAQQSIHAELLTASRQLREKLATADHTGAQAELEAIDKALTRFNREA